MQLDAKQFGFDPETRQYCEEVSTLQLPGIPQTILLRNAPKEGQHRSFRCVGTDDNGGDIAGWRFEEEEGPNRGRSWEEGHPPKTVTPLSILLIND